MMQSLNATVQAVELLTVESLTYIGLLYDSKSRCNSSSSCVSGQRSVVQCQVSM